jgi:ABC-type bacteriocin/lantibiotic exporter with double-glycine peptidase domain
MNDKKITPFKRLIRLLSNERDLVGNIYIYALFNGLLNLSIPLGIQAIINLIQSGTTSTSWIVLVILVLVGLTLAGVFQIFQLSISETIQQKIFANASVEFAFRLPRLKRSALRSMYLPELVNRFFDILTVQKGLSKILFDFSLAALQIFFGLLLLALYHPFFIAFGILLLLILVVFFWFTFQKGLDTSLQESKYKYKLVGWLEEVARNISTFKMAGDTRLPMERTDEHSMNYLEARKRHFKVLLRQYGLLIAFKVVIAGSLLILGGVLVFNQEMNIGQFVAAEIIILLIINSVEKLILSMETIYDVLTGLEKVGTVTDLDLEETEGRTRVNNPLPNIGVKMKNITLPAPQDPNKIILKDISFDVKPGEKIGVAGPMGSGKTSLLHMVAGLFDEFKGSIFYNEIPIRHLDLESLRSAIGDNLRDEEIFEGSLLENITIRRSGNDSDRMKAIIDVCGLNDFVEELPEGLYTQLPSAGLGLAKSIINRILLARSLAGEHGMFLMIDEWSELNKQVVDRWFDYVCLSCPQTMFLSSNNPELLKKMDRVLVMDEGAIKAQGKYNDIKDLL